MRIEDYLTNIEYIDEDFDAGILFSSIDFRRGYAIPTDTFWEIWHSDNKAKLVQAELIPRKCGYSLGVSSAWVVRLPLHPQTGGTEHVSEVMTRCLLSFISDKVV